MPAIDRTIEVSTSAQKVWDYMSEFRHTEEWDPPTERTVRTQGDGGVGTVYENTSTILGASIDITYTVVEFDPPRRVRLEGRSPSMTSLDTIEVVPHDHGATLHYRADFTLDGLAKAAEPLMPLGLKKLGDAAEEQIRRRLQDL